MRATVETVAESTVDGILPDVLCSRGWRPGLWAYKAINTLDSMVGHHEAPYTRFGWAAARLDDVANFIPARLGLILFGLERGSSEEAEPLLACRLARRRQTSESEFWHRRGSDGRGAWGPARWHEYYDGVKTCGRISATLFNRSRVLVFPKPFA